MVHNHCYYYLLRRVIGIFERLPFPNPTISNIIFAGMNAHFSSGSHNDVSGLQSVLVLIWKYN